MNEEEKEAIECLELVIDSESDIETEDLTNKCINNILNLIKKQSKEIEELKDKNKTLETLLQGNLFEMYNYYKELANSYQANCISKDKIKEKIEELKNRKIGASTGIFAVQVDILEELLEE